MVTDARWAAKITALLHDPPDKPFAIAGHKERARALLRIALGREPTAGEWECAKRADQIASAADRVNFPQGSEAYWHRERAVLTHPLAGRALDLRSLADITTEKVFPKVEEAVRQLVDGTFDLRQRYLRLWRLLPEALGKACPDIGSLWAMLPADTRQPDHPLHQHVSITAAIADALPNPALLVFSLRPVQEFISAARRTQDLWMGSWLISYLVWAAIKSIAQAYGPDVLIYPALREQPLCDLWLVDEGVIPEGQRPSVDHLTLATLPNKFVALLPAPEASKAAEAAEAVLREKWVALVEAVRQGLEKTALRPDNRWPIAMWERQAKAQWEVYWAVLPWPGANVSKPEDQAKAVRDLFEDLCNPDHGWQFGRVYELCERSGAYAPNWGTTYSLLYTLADRAFNARKGMRSFIQAEEKGEKCTLCGQRSAVHGEDTSRRGVRRFWGSLAQEVRQQSANVAGALAGEHAALKAPDGSGEGRER
ncbi:type III-B CRISPR-associated protein Cas10/Cmr2, partial [Candidatus Bathyarchaeota archaeon]